SRTTNSGLNWTPANTPTTDWSMFMVKCVSASEIYAVGDPGFLYKSTDLGVSWSALPISVTGTAVTFVWYSLDHYGSTYILSGDYGQIAMSTDGCATWSAPGYFQLSNSLIYNITNVPGTAKYWAVGRAFPFGSSTKQIMYSSNGGTNWTTYNVGVVADFTSISMINENTGYISGTNNRVMKTTDGGASWVAKTGPSPVATSQIYTCDFIDENTGWVFVNFSTVAGGNIFKTTNGGDNWNQYTTGTSSENIYSADMVDANTGFCVMNTSNKPIFRTTNGGVNWTGATTTGFTGSIRDITSKDGNTVYACQTSGTSRVAKSTNGGVNWTLITLPAAVDANSIDFKDNNTGYVSGNTSGIICRTTNGGANWTFQNTHQITGINVFVSQGDTAWNVGGNGAILRYAGVNSKVSVNLTLSLEAMYDTGTNNLVRKDTVKVYLRNSTSPYAVVDSAKSIIDTVTLSGQFTFPNAPSGTYYIQVNHFNSIETWSKNGGETMISGTPYNYDFTSAALKAYGSNQVLVGSEWSTFSGDVNQDGIIDLTDVVLISNDVNDFVTGSYVVTDLNADNAVTLADLIIAYNNSSSFVIVNRP
ncbi:MAG TPA: YCF48-related protein, partial [Ignavibacteria bacterium]|nr:YCF48-related protein [Ignavibacteria bacterium]